MKPGPDACGEGRRKLWAAASGGPVAAALLLGIAALIRGNSEGATAMAALVVEFLYTFALALVMLNSAASAKTRRRKLRASASVIGSAATFSASGRQAASGREAEPSRRSGHDRGTPSVGGALLHASDAATVAFRRCGESRSRPGAPA